MIAIATVFSTVIIFVFLIFLELVGIIEYNIKNGITPQTIKKKISNTLQEMTAKETDTTKKINLEEIKDIDKKLREYNKIMQQAASDLDFEKAIEYRDKIKQLENLYLKS